MLLKSRLPKGPQGVPPLHAGLFFQEVWTAPQARLEALIRLRDQDRAAFDAGLQDTLRRHERRESIAALEALALGGELTVETARLLWPARLALQRWAEALQILEDPRFARPRHANWWYDVACARAGCGATVQALAAVREAAARDPEGPEIAELAAALERLSDYQARPQGPSNWQDLKDHVGLLIELHQFGQAAAVLSEALTRLGPSASLKKLHIALALARTLFRVIDPPTTLSLLLRLKPAFERAGLGGIHEWACAELTAPEGEAWRPPPSFGDQHFLRACVGQAFAAVGRWKTATSLLGEVATLRDDPFDCRVDLSRCVGRAVLEDFPPRFAPPSPHRKIVKVFRFFDEFLLLRLKLEEMAPWVDRFVIIEATSTFTGQPKPLLFEQRRDEFAPWADKIQHMVVDFPPWADSAWGREFYQRDMGVQALSGYVGPDDLVLISDADEILKREPIEGFTGDFAALGMDVYNYFFNFRRLYDSQPTYGVVWRAKYLDGIGLSAAGMAPTPFSKWHILPDAGWHFTSIKDAEGLLIKLQAYSHTEYAGIGRMELVQRLERIRDGEPFIGHQRCEIDEAMPRAVRDNQDLISEFILGRD